MTYSSGTLMILVLAPWLSNCSKIANLDNIRVTEKSRAVIPASSPLQKLLSGFGFEGFNNFDVTDNQELENQGVKKSQIEHVKLVGFRLQILEPPSGQDFTFLEDIKFYVESEGLEKKLIAHGGPFAAGAGAVSLKLERLDLAPYITASSMSISSIAKGSLPPQETTVEAIITLDVEADVGGAVLD